VKKEKAMNATELKTKTPDQLRDQLVALKKEAFNLRLKIPLVCAASVATLPVSRRF
jgi:large subunit ribosomal protein L29